MRGRIKQGVWRDRRIYGTSRRAVKNDKGALLHHLDRLYPEGRLDDDCKSLAPETAVWCLEVCPRLCGYYYGLILMEAGHLDSTYRRIGCYKFPDLEVLQAWEYDGKWQIIRIV